jgi:hypothetical protein
VEEVRPDVEAPVPPAVEHLIEEPGRSRVLGASMSAAVGIAVVGSVEADVADGLISIDSPVGRALLGHRRGDALDVRTPGGIRRLTIVDVSVREVALGRVSGEGV